MIRALLSALAGFVLTASAFALSAEKQADFEKVAAAWNAVPAAAGAFYQTDSNGGTASGRFWLQKPGRFRFEYAEPEAQLVVADGLTVAVEDKRLETQDRYPLIESPLSILVDDKIALTKRIQLIDVQRRAGEIIVFIRSTEENAEGDLALVFADTDLSLKYWQVTDPAGTQVTVQLQEVQVNPAMEPGLFFIKDPGREEIER